MSGFGSFLTVVAVIMIIVAVILAVYRRTDPDLDSYIGSWPAGLTIFGIILLVIGILMATFIVIQPGHALQVVRLGKLYGPPRGQGVHTITPFIDHAVVIDCRVRKFEYNIEAGTIETQPITIKGVFAWKVNRAKLGEIINEVGLDFEAKAVDPVIEDGIKAACGQHKAESFNRDRRLIMDDAMKIVDKEWRARYKDMFMAQQASMVDFTFTDEGYKQAIIDKQKAEQTAQKEKYNLDAAELKAQQQIATAEGVSKSQALQREALRNAPEVIEFKRLEVTEKAIEKWDGKAPTTVFNTGNGSTPFLFNLDTLQH